MLRELEGRWGGRRGEDTTNWSCLVSITLGTKASLKIKTRTEILRSGNGTQAACKSLIKCSNFLACIHIKKTKNNYTDPTAETFLTVVISGRQVACGCPISAARVIRVISPTRCFLSQSVLTRVLPLATLNGWKPVITSSNVLNAPRTF